MQKVFVLFGAPGSGKSEACRIFSLEFKNKVRIIQKETTRPERESDGIEIKSVKTISKKCDFRYSQYDWDYGFSSKDIWSGLGQKKSIVLIINDIRTIKLVKRKFGNLVHTIYIHANIDRNQIEKVSKERYPSANKLFLAKDIEKRVEKIKAIHRKYIDNTKLFDSTIINLIDVYSNFKELENQIIQIYLSDYSSPRIANSSCQILIIAGGSFAGKDDLVQAMINIEPNKVVDYKKGSTRPRKDKNDNGLEFLKPLTNKYDIVYFMNDHKYGISTRYLWSHLAQEKIVIIVLSDLESIVKIKSEFDKICSTVYLHANLDEEELNKAKKELSNSEFIKRQNSISEIHKMYINNIKLFDHVLLNTSISEDLYDQAFNILDLYLEGYK